MVEDGGISRTVIRVGNERDAVISRRFNISDRRIILLILLGALVIRVLLVVLTIHKYAPVNDSKDFSRIATSISTGNGFGVAYLDTAKGPSAFRTPLFPGLLSAVYLVAGVSWTAARLAMSIISTALVASVGLLAWKAGGRRIGLVALLVATVYPPLILAAYGLNYEDLMGVFVCCSLAAGMHWRDSGRWRWLVVSGVLVGLAVLCRENGALLLVPLWIIIIGRRSHLQLSGVVRRILVVSLCAAAVVVPWTIRNAVVMHAFIPVSDSPGLALACEYNATSALHAGSDFACYLPQADPTDRAKLRAIGPAPSETLYESTLQNAAKQYILHHLSYLPRAVGWNVVRLFDLRGPRDSLYLADVTPWPRHLLELSIVAFYALAAVIVAGLVFVRREIARLPRVLWVFPVLWCLSLIVSVADSQYRLVAEPFLIIAVAAVLLAVRDSLRRRTLERTSPQGPD